MKTRIVQTKEGWYRVEKKPKWSPVWLRVYGYKLGITLSDAVTIAYRLANPVIKEYP